jgi:hypothetical protein
MNCEAWSYRLTFISRLVLLILSQKIDNHIEHFQVVGSEAMQRNLKASGAGLALIYKGENLED